MENKQEISNAIIVLQKEIDKVERKSKNGQLLTTQEKDVKTYRDSIQLVIHELSKLV